MKNLKVVVWLILLGFIGLVIFQNQAFFLQRTSLAINLFVAQYHTAEMPIAILILGCLIAGMLISYFFSLASRFRSNKTIKSLNTTIDSNRETIAKLESELATARSQAALDVQQPVEESAPSSATS